MSFSVIHRQSVVAAVSRGGEKARTARRGQEAARRLTRRAELQIEEIVMSFELSSG